MIIYESLEFNIILSTRMLRSVFATKFDWPSNLKNFLFKTLYLTDSTIDFYFR